MTESHEPYIAGRKKVYDIKVTVDAPNSNIVDLSNKFFAWVRMNGWKCIDGNIEVTYEEE